MTPIEKAIAMCETHKEYMQYSVMFGTVDKLFNDGNGALGLYRFGESDNVTVNTVLETKPDRKRLMKLFPNCIPFEEELGYPDWYSRSLSNPDNLPA